LWSLYVTLADSARSSHVTCVTRVTLRHHTHSWHFTIPSPVSPPALHLGHPRCTWAARAALGPSTLHLGHPRCLCGCERLSHALVPAKHECRRLSHTLVPAKHA
jgi:hypothetical protein